MFACSQWLMVRNGGNLVSLYSTDRQGREQRPLATARGLASVQEVDAVLFLIAFFEQVHFVFDYS